jgi:anti-anti-sigma regulatory factor
MVVHMATTAAFLRIEEQHVLSALQEAGAKLENINGETVLDCSSVSRINTHALRALEEFARIADEKAIKVVVRGASIDVYKVLKLVKLAGRFSFAN